LVKVELDDAAPALKAAVNGAEVSFDCACLPNRQYSLIRDGRVFDFMVDLASNRCDVVGREGTHALKVMDRRRSMQRHEVEEGQSGLQRLTADMPGKVVRILVKEGDSVSYDQGLLVLEAMKMQNEIRSPKSGIVREVGAIEGKAVSTGEFLLSLE
jgi:biotin carboxyl carrier protein